MSTQNNFEKLNVWQLSHQLVLEIYKLTDKFPVKERYRLVDQICRSTSSVPANIVEGNSRRSAKEYLQFVNVAFASLQETKYHLLLSRDLGYLDLREYDLLIVKTDNIGKMLNSLKKYLRSKIQDQKSNLK